MIVTLNLLTYGIFICICIIGFILDVVNHAHGSSRPLILTIHVVVRSHVETRDLV
jgi:hypothetical protein